MKESNKKIAVGAIIAGAAGYVVGILTAPKSGKETRQDIQKTAAKAKAEAERRLKSLHSELTTLIGRAKKSTTKLQRSAAVEYNKAIDKAQNAKHKASEILSALHEGDADDEDLQKAVKDVNQAIDHLKKYVTKNDTNQKAR